MDADMLTIVKGLLVFYGVVVGFLGAMWGLDRIFR